MQASRILIVGKCGRTEAYLRVGPHPRGYRVECCKNTEAAWERISRAAYHAVIVDGACPGAQRLLERIRAGDSDRYTYTILIGGKRDQASIERSIVAGADDVLDEGVSERVLLARLQVARRVARRSERLARVNDVLERTNARMRRELQAAAQVQLALLPSSDFTAPGVELGWRLRPCEELAGDLLNCIRVDEHHLAFYVLDVSGHGVSSALMSVQISRLMSPSMSESELLKQRLKRAPWYRVVEPVEVLGRLNELFHGGPDSGHYFTMIYGLVHLKSGRLRFATAGHPGPLLDPVSAAAEQIVCRSHPVGIIDDPQFQDHELTLGSGDRLWFYSDGVTEVSDCHERELGVEGLCEQVIAQRERPLPRAVHEVMAGVESWSRPAKPADDCTLLAIEGRAPL